MKQVSAPRLSVACCGEVLPALTLCSNCCVCLILLVIRSVSLLLHPHANSGSPQVRCGWGLSPGQESALTSAVFLGTMLGVSSWGAVADGLGRRKGFAATALFVFAFGILSALSPNYPVRQSRDSQPLSLARLYSQTTQTPIRRTVTCSAPPITSSRS